MAWAKELITRGFGLDTAEDILHREHRGFKLVSGTTWYIRTHGVGVDVFKMPEIGGIDFDFDKPDPDPWRMQIFVERQVNEGNLPYEPYRTMTTAKFAGGNSTRATILNTASVIEAKKTIGFVRNVMNSSSS